MRKLAAFVKKVPVCLASLFLISGCAKEKPYLSNLQATADSPLYATYAANMNRSEFTLDEGYEFMFYNPERGVEFTTDTGGDIGLGFIVNGKWIYKLADMFKAPVISVSYPDMVVYRYYPVEGLRVDATFLVQSSHTAVTDIQVTNETTTEKIVEVLPMLRNKQRTFNNVQLKKGDNAFTFWHAEYPDGWVLEHEVPYVDKVQNVFLFSEAPDESLLFNTLGNESPVPATEPANAIPSVFRVTGRAKTGPNRGDQVKLLPPDVRLQVYLNNSDNRLITENSPVWGTYRQAVQQDGYFMNELGQLGTIKNGDSYTLAFYSQPANKAYQYTNNIDTAKGKSYNRELVLTDYTLPAIPQNVRLQQNESSVTLSWDNAGSNLKYNVYRRNYALGGVYEQVAKALSTPLFTDQLPAGQVCGYIVTSVTGSQMGIHSAEVTTLPRASFAAYLNNEPVLPASILEGNSAKLLAFKKKLTIPANATKAFRMVRSVSRPDVTDQQRIADAKPMLTEDLAKYQQENETLFSKVPKPAFANADEEMLYWSAFNMMRQVFLPAEGKSSYNYYVFSREPTWGWGHGGQVFHESISMLAYAYMDPVSAMNSQRVYSERQHDNGYINYRSGAFLDEVIENDGLLTSSAPWYAWQNYEIYKITKDELFLKEMYQSSKKFYNFFVSNRDVDNDGLVEWNGHAILESVRDALVAVWDEVGWPSNFESLDANCMLVMEAKSMEQMALQLGLKEEADQWKADWTKRAELINQTFWDDETGFYYNVDRKNNTFTFNKLNDLKRKEIIGFLPMWAGIVPQNRIGRLTDHLFNPSEFWRKYGVPTLSADDPYYNDKGYWNGPVWVEWDLFIMQGLLQYGYKKEAKELVDRVAENMVLQLKKDHNLWEFYSPDEQWAGYHKTYIWAGVINRMMMDVQDCGLKTN